MENRNIKSTRLALASMLALALSACDGPWNMSPEAGPRPAKLWVSLLAVADRPFDTLWMERPLALDKQRDSSLAFVDTAASAVFVYDAAGGDTVRFRNLPGRAAAWLPLDTAFKVKRGHEYALRADVRWNASADFPDGAAWRREVLTATTQVPAVYNLDSVMDAPMESLHPSLSVGLPAASLARARGDAAYRQTLFDSLDAIPRPGSLSSHDIAPEDFARYLKGEVVLRPVHDGDSVYYIFDGSEATDFSGIAQHRYSLAWLFHQQVARADFGGVILSQHFDSTGSRIYDPLTKSINDAFNSKLDSVEFYQRGNVRPMIVGGPYYTGLKGYPDTLRLTNLLWGYTGRNVLYGYAVDPLYYEYYKGMLQSGMDQGAGLGGGNSRAQNVLRYSNVENGDGYFTGAVADSFAVHIKAVRDTVAISALRDAWLRGKKK